MRRLLVVAGILTLLAGCGSSDDKDSSGYPKSAGETFVKSCANVISGQADQTKAQAQCECAFAKIEGLISYEKFKSLDAALSKGDTLDPKLEKTLRDAIAACEPS